MKRKNVAILLISAMLLGTGACSEKSGFTSGDFKPITQRVKNTYSFAETEAAETAKYSEDKLKEFQSGIREYCVEYGYEELFNYEKAMEGLLLDSTVEIHGRSALDENGKLTKEHLFDIVKENNKEYLKQATSVYKAVDDKVVLEICEII